MSKERLQSTLQQLHEELSRAQGVDSETLARLRTVADDMQRALDKDDDTSSPDVESEARNLNDLLLKFESEHPQLAIAVGRVADALAAMGI